MINFYETIKPRIEYALEKFIVQQDLLSETVKFLDLQLNFKEPFCDTDIVTYGCNLCNVHFTGFKGKALLNEHFQEKHQAEQPLLCCKCAKQFDICYLVGVRWSHVCSRN